MSSLFFAPAVLFMMLFAVIVALSVTADRFAFKPESKGPVSGGKAYACGEDFEQHLIRPDYSQFFPFAFFFTILHVVALMVATIPSQKGLFAAGIIYLGGAVTGLIILFRRSS